MKAVEVMPGIYWVGAKDWNVRDFHGYQTQRGTTYNAYLILDEKITLIDTVKETHRDEMMARIRTIIDPAKINVVVCNHVELDHSGSLPHVMNIAKNAELITSKNGEKGLNLHFATEGWKIRAVASGEEMSLGKRTLKFIHTPMVHWPDSMVTYIPQDKLLLPNDAFGQHFATDSIFNDEGPRDIIMHESAKYYANIIYPFGKRVLSVLDAVQGLDIKMIASSHGVIWRTELETILANYRRWAQGESARKAVVIYDSMWASTEAMAHAVKAGFEEQGVGVVVRSLKHNHISDVITDVLESRFVAIGSPTLNNQVLPSVAGFLGYMRGLCPHNKIGFAFGSYGWYREGLKEITNTMAELKWEMPLPTASVNYRPSDAALKQLKDSIVGLCR